MYGSRLCACFQTAGNRRFSRSGRLPGLSLLLHLQKHIRDISDPILFASLASLLASWTRYPSCQDYVDPLSTLLDLNSPHCSSNYAVGGLVEVSSGFVTDHLGLSCDISLGGPLLMVCYTQAPEGANAEEECSVHSLPSRHCRDRIFPLLFFCPAGALISINDMTHAKTSPTRGGSSQGPRAPPAVMPPTYWQRHTMRMTVGFALLEVEALGSLPRPRILLEVPTTSKTRQVRTHRTRVGKLASSLPMPANLHGRLVRWMFHIQKTSGPSIP